LTGRRNCLQHADIDDALEPSCWTCRFAQGSFLFWAVYAQVDAAHRGARREANLNEALKRVLDVLATDLIETTGARSRLGPVIRGRDSPGAKTPRRFSAIRAAKIANSSASVRPHLQSSRDHEDRDRSVEMPGTTISLLPGRGMGSMPAAYEELGKWNRAMVIVCDYTSPA